MRGVCIACGNTWMLSHKSNKYVDRDSFVCDIGCLYKAIKSNLPGDTHPSQYPLASSDEYAGSGEIACNSELLKMTFRSNFEARVCEWLHHKKIVFEYEKYRFLLKTAEENNGLPLTWMPDLYLPEYGIFLEVKGLKGAGFTKKLTLFRQQLPFPVILVPWTLNKEFPALIDPYADFFKD